MESLACKNDNSACLYFLIMSLDLYFYFISGLFLGHHLILFYDFCRIIQQINAEFSRAKIKTGFLPSFLIIYPDP